MRTSAWSGCPRGCNGPSTWPGRGDATDQPTAVERAVKTATEVAGIGSTEVDVVELHDATAIAELNLYEELGLCQAGDAPRLVRDKLTWLGGELPVNPSGGLLSRGHPIGATGAAQVVELVWQLQGRCGDRQVPDAKAALAQNAGGWVGTSVVVGASVTAGASVAAGAWVAVGAAPPQAVTTLARTRSDNKTYRLRFTFLLLREL